MPRRRLRDLSIVQNTPNSEETNSEKKTAMDLRMFRIHLTNLQKFKVMWIRSSTFSRRFGHYSTKCQYVASQLRVMASNA
ncbi:hypothetical protein Gotur_034499 [Gossypium turneri]